jgi:protoporphyrinogen oxidase
VNKHVVIVGASIGGLIAAAALRCRGIDVTILEKGSTVGGLYGKVDTPFGKQELGMHVLYLTAPHYQHLVEIFGEHKLKVWHGYKVDIGGAFNFGKTFFNSIYPDVRALPQQAAILQQLVANASSLHQHSNASAVANSRFGAIAAQTIVLPILKKLWQIEPSLLSAGALHCFYDLRRIVACEKTEADQLKQDPAIDQVLGNPEQRQPAGAVFNGRMAARFTNHCGDLSAAVVNWLHAQDIKIHFNTSVAIDNGQLILNNAALAKQCDACIIASPLPALIPDARSRIESRELSIYYFQLAEVITVQFPAYYLLCHDPNLHSSRIVNYSAYHDEQDPQSTCVIAVEVLHIAGTAPTEQDIATELCSVLPFASILASYKLPNTMPVPVPSLANAAVMDEYTEQLQKNNGDMPVYFSGMRTDQGLFFSHHTIGNAYDSALACAARLS